MNIRYIFKLHIVLIICLSLGATTAFAQGIKERMTKRAPAIATLKAKGVVGENNKGYLGFVGSARENEAMVAAENKDRRVIYTYFAKQQKTSLGIVEKVQAKRKAERAKSGEYVQNAGGAWVKK